MDDGDGDDDLGTDSRLQQFDGDLLLYMVVSFVGRLSWLVWISQPLLLR